MLPADLVLFARELLPHCFFLGRQERQTRIPALIWFYQVGKLFYIASGLPGCLVTYSIQRRPKPDRRVWGAYGESQVIFASAAREKTRKKFFTRFFLFLLCSWQQGSTETFVSRDQREMILPHFDQKTTLRVPEKGAPEKNNPLCSRKVNLDFFLNPIK